MLAADIDPLSCLAVAANARRNGVEVTTVCADLVGGPTSEWDVILAADIWYERFMAQRVGSWLHEQAASGVQVLVGDVGRAYLPRSGLVELVRHAMPAVDGFERDVLAVGVVYRLGSTRENTARPNG